MHRRLLPPESQKREAGPRKQCVPRQSPGTRVKVTGTLRRAVRWSELTMIPGERHMECAYYFYFLDESLVNRSSIRSSVLLVAELFVNNS